MSLLVVLGPPPPIPRVSQIIGPRNGTGQPHSRGPTSKIGQNTAATFHALWPSTNGLNSFGSAGIPSGGTSHKGVTMDLIAKIIAEVIIQLISSGSAESATTVASMVLGA